MGSKTSKIRIQSNGHQKEFSVLVWNLQGLREDFLKERSLAILEIMKAKKPKAILFQELVASTYSLFRDKLFSEYAHFSTFNIRAVKPRYFTGIFLKHSTFGSAYPELIRFPQSTQGRDMLIVNALYGTYGVTFVTSHLESTLYRQAERKNQLGILCQTMLEQPKTHTTIYGGDTNLSDHEFDAVVKDGKFNDSQVCDVWKMLGSPEDSRYSWDPIENDNESVSDAEFSKKRLDRIFVRSASDKKVPSFKPTEIELVGMKRLPCGLFISDHWGIMVTLVLDVPSD